MSVLETGNLTVGYKRGKEVKQVLREVNLSLEKGELVCFLGPNGVGKSTLLRTLAKVQQPLSGEIFIHQKPLHKIHRTELAQIMSLVLTENVRAGSLSVYELVALGRHPYTNWSGTLAEKDRKTIQRAIEMTGIAPLTGEKVFALSDGQRQKVMIARALAQDGDILILDEPTAHLDLNNRMEIMDLLSRLAAETGKSILVSTHELDLALQTADKLWLAGFDRPVVSGVPEDLVLTGAVERTFFKDEVKFDVHTGKFRRHRRYHSRVKLAGGGAARQWTAHALERKGFSVSEADAKISIGIEPSIDGFSWILTCEDRGTKTFGSLEQLLAEVCREAKLMENA